MMGAAAAPGAAGEVRLRQVGRRQVGARGVALFCDHRGQVSAHQYAAPKLCPREASPKHGIRWQYVEAPDQNPTTLPEATKVFGRKT